MIEDALRQTGITAIGDVPWGTHFCQFYKTKQDLLDLLVPYFTEGLAHHEFCMWVTSEPIEVDEAKAALRQTVPDLDRRLAAGQLEIISYADWYRLGGAFDADRVLNGWVDRLNQARGKGFEGLRLSGNTFWLESKEWAAFTDYEERVNRVIGRYRMMALCTYSLDKCGASEVIDVVSNHRFALIKRHGQWARIQSAEQQRVEEELRESEAWFRTLTESLPQLVWTCLPDGRCDYLSRQWIAYTGIPETVQLGYGWIEQVHPDDRRHVQEVWAAAVRDGTLFDVEFRIRRADGHYRWFKTRAVPWRDQAGCIVKWFGSNTDIDELRRAEAEIRRQAETLERRVRERTAALSGAKEWFQALVETTSDWIWEIDRNGTYTYASPRVKDILGYEPEALIGKTPFALMSSDEAERVAAQFRAIVGAQAPFAGLEHTNLHKSGRRVVLETSGVPFFDHEGRVLGYRGVDRDITARKDMEARANRLERLAAMGQLLSGVAHELKNPLFILTGYLRIGQETLAQRRYEALSEEWKKIQDVAKRLEDITERFLRLALPIVGQRQRCSVPDILRNILNVARNELAQNRIAVRAVYAPDLPETWLDAGQVREVFLNLVENAIQSMAEAHGQGTLTVSAQPSPVGARPPVSEERWIEVRIQDDGAGIPPEIQSKMFEPFFTTKPAGKGTGLGLWIVRSNLMMLHGSVQVETEVGRGTTFIVRLPVVEEPAASADPPLAPEKGRDQKDRA